MLKNYAQNDPTALTLENAFYRNLQKGFGPKNSGLYVSLMAKDQDVFYSHFITAMIKLGTIRVKTGNEGEITQDCGSSNR
jgi:peroxidase